MRETFTSIPLDLNLHSHLRCHRVHSQRTPLLPLDGVLSKSMPHHDPWLGTYQRTQAHRVLSHKRWLITLCRQLHSMLGHSTSKTLITAPYSSVWTVTLSPSPRVLAEKMKIPSPLEIVGISMQTSEWARDISLALSKALEPFWEVNIPFPWPLGFKTSWPNLKSVGQVRLCCPKHDPTVPISLALILVHPPAIGGLSLVTRPITNRLNLLPAQNSSTTPISTLSTIDLTIGPGVDA